MLSIKELRQRSGLTQAEAGEQFGVSFRTIQNWENNKTAPSKVNMNRLIEMYTKLIHDRANILER